MQKLIAKFTARQKLGLSFALYVLVFLAIFATAFFFVFKSVLLLQLKRDMALGINEVLTEHVTVDNGNIVFTQDAIGNELQSELVRIGFSALFLDKDLNLINDFGVFSLYNIQDKQTISELQSLSKRVIDTKQVQQAQLIWQNQRLFVFFVPIKYNDTVSGVAILGKPFTEIDAIIKLLVLLLSTFGVFAVLASFVLGYVLSAKSFAPIYKFNKIIDEIDLDKLDKTLSIYGHDNDELVILATGINRMLARIQDMSMQQREFVSNVSHELRTPLTRAVSSLEVLDPSDTGYATEVRTIKQDLMDVSSLLEKLLVLSRLRKETVEQSTGRTKLASLFNELEGELRAEYEAKAIKLNVSVSEDMFVNIPYEYAKVLFRNLLSNAVLYSNVHTKVSVMAKRDENDLIVTITDEGIGMTQDELTKVFDRFYRANGGKYMVNGSGIGLSIVKRLCDLYDIVISMTSTKGKGTQVELDFKI